MFKVGDLVICKIPNLYTVTNEKTICKVTSIVSNGNEIYLKLISSKDKDIQEDINSGYYNNFLYRVLSKHFIKILEKKNNTKWI